MQELGGDPTGPAKGGVIQMPSNNLNWKFWYANKFNYSR